MQSSFPLWKINEANSIFFSFSFTYVCERAVRHAAPMVDPLSFLLRSLRALQSRQRNVTSDGDKVIRTSFTSRFAPSWHDLRHNPRRFWSNFDASSPRSTIPPPLVRIHSRARAFPVPGSACSRDGNVYLSSAIFKLPCERNRARARLASSRPAFRLAAPRPASSRPLSSRPVSRSVSRVTIYA